MSYYSDNSNPTPGNSSFGSVKLVKRADIEKCKYFRYGIGLNTKGTFLFPTGGFSKNLIVFGVDMSSSVHVDNKKKDLLILDEVLIQVLDDTKLNTDENY